MRFYLNNIYVGNNFTSKSSVLINNVHKSWIFEYKPNLSNENKVNYITDNWICDKKLIENKHIPYNFTQNLIFNKKLAILAFMLNWDDNFLNIDNNGFNFNILEKNKTEIKDYIISKSNIFSIFENIDYKNENIFSNTQNKKNFFYFMAYINYYNISNLSDLKSSIDKFNNINL